MLSEFSRYDAWERGTRFEVPIFIFQGEKDVLTTPALAREFFDDVIAPVKRMELISDAGHFAAFQQPENFLGLLLTHVRHMADVPTRELLNNSRSRCKDVDERNVIRPECL